MHDVPPKEKIPPPRKLRPPPAYGRGYASSLISSGSGAMYSGLPAYAESSGYRPGPGGSSEKMSLHYYEPGSRGVPMSIRRPGDTVEEEKSGSTDYVVSNKAFDPRLSDVSSEIDFAKPMSTDFL